MGFRYLFQFYCRFVNGSLYFLSIRPAIENRFKFEDIPASPLRRSCKDNLENFTYHDAASWLDSSDEM